MSNMKIFGRNTAVMRVIQIQRIVGIVALDVTVVRYLTKIPHSLVQCIARIKDMSCPTQVNS